ncbi:MAG: response regulator [Alphaproteobacteria bacterium]|uniref:response regulator n=1 Tax=Rhizobium/Agrobacterium group TaxID=227290 RepID=UPI00083CCE22|nr:response regulator [Agrobacterium sp. RAC06]MBU0738115.1 response regulator [Alphaproteobacteria bacterium]MDM7981985.1 response regulator [Rhizobium sp.]AOG09833.1 response regulator [Agrobacterium sp. RAC06]MBU0835058.1 response regulator [Alphaproteobacteria bacterium]MBU1764071.1 response regulator [Alphaproteobacteria bacterium]
MSLTARVAVHLPYLRRYARAVTGSQTSGDAYVAAVLEALIADISIFPDTGDDRVALYKLFVTIYDSTKVELPQITSPFAWEKRAAANLASVPTRARHAFLLITVEGFTTSEAASVLSVGEAEFNALFNEASMEISRQVATDIMIIEDEPLIALDIEQMVEDLGHRVTGIARTHAEAVDLYKRTSPKMVLADIQLADGSSGIDAVNDILKVDSIPVIFITAFPERLLTGERPEPAFLVTKPFNPDMVKALISQALFFNERVTEQA